MNSNRYEETKCLSLFVWSWVARRSDKTIISYTCSYLMFLILVKMFWVHRHVVSSLLTRTCDCVSLSLILKIIQNYTYKHHILHFKGIYSKTCVQQLLLKRQKIGFQDQSSLNAGPKYCRMLQGEHSAILSTFIQLPFVIKIFVLSIFEWRFTQNVLYMYMLT